ncbi:hypothetical protein ACT721_00935 [Ornithobacterium rhinotracheale]|uniref:hypothetical protein n=1 Tax=Ornithobacterium rhinotracheale TaxID=28251 RepID=UPI00403986B4
MIENIWIGVLDWFEGRNERMKTISNFNASAKMAFIQGEVPTLLKAKTSKGDPKYKHQYSNWYNTGFRIQAFSGRQLSRDEIIQIGEVILNDDKLVRRLVVLCWDTLEVHGDVGDYGCKWQLKDHILLPKY